MFYKVSNQYSDQKINPLFRTEILFLLDTLLNLLYDFILMLPAG